MNDDDFDIPVHDDDEAPNDEPFVRATITRRGIWLNSPGPGLITGGPASMTLERLDGRCVLVDLRAEGEGRELIATVPPNAPALNAEAARRLASWAAVVGYRRLWLPWEVFELEDPPTPMSARVTCPTCRSEWADSSPRFWTMVRECGHFPGYCPACGGSLPEWRTQPARSGSAEQAPSLGARPASRASNHTGQ